MSCSETVLSDAGLSEEKWLAELKRSAIDVFCAVIAYEEIQDGMSEQEAEAAVSWARDDLLARQVVLVRNDHKFQYLMGLAYSYGGYKNTSDRLSEKFVVINFDDGTNRALLFLPLGWSYMELPKGKVILDGKTRARGMVKPTDDHLVGRLELDFYYEITVRPGDGDVISVIKVMNYESECIASFDYTAEMVRNRVPDEVVMNTAYAYMNQKYPKWLNPMAYWDD